MASLLAGCASPGGEEATPQLDVPAVALPTLPCEPDPSGTGLSPSLEVLAFETFDGDGAFREEIDTAHVGGRTLLAVSQPNGDTLEFLDVTDPTSPRLVSSWSGDGGILDDVKFLPDASGLVTVGEELRILDVRDLEDVRVEDTIAMGYEGREGGYAHTVAAWDLDGRTYVSLAKAEGGDVSIFAVEGETGARSLTRLAHVGATPISMLPSRPDPVRSHDTWFERDPVTGTPLLWVANVHWGVLAYDVTDPAQPVVVSTMLPAPDNPIVGYMHTAQVTHVDGRRLVVGAQEFETGVLKVWDATDLRAPKYIGYYHTDVIAYAFHNMQVVGPYVFATHFHDGLFVFDLRDVPTTDGPAAKMELFAHAPAEGVADEQVRQFGRMPGAYDGTFEVVVQDGVLWTTEVGAGIRSLAFGCLEPGDPAATSTG